MVVLEIYWKKTAAELIFKKFSNIFPRKALLLEIWWKKVPEEVLFEKISNIFPDKRHHMEIFWKKQKKVLTNDNILHKI